MLFDPKWTDTKAKPDVFSLDGLIAWLEKQPPEGEYDWKTCAGECLVGQYLASHWGRYIPGHYSGFLPEHRFDIIVPNPQTFGAALSRARKIAENR